MQCSVQGESCRKAHGVLSLWLLLFVNQLYALVAVWVVCRPVAAPSVPSVGAAVRSTMIAELEPAEMVQRVSVCAY